jgi:hypothetical protein
MGQPIPPGDSPLYDGLDSSWNDIVGAFPEDQRATLAPLLKQRIDSIESNYAPLKQWEDFQKSGITPEHATTALNLFSTIENDPRKVYDTIGQHLGLTPQQAQQVQQMQQEVEEGDEDDPRIIAMQQQLETIGQLLLTERQQKMAAQQAAEQDAAVDKELKDLRSKYGDVDEEEVLMRMLHGNMNAEQAYQAYVAKHDTIRRTRPAPMVMGSGGAVPRKTIDPTKLDRKDTKALVAQMMQQANNASRG